MQRKLVMSAEGYARLHGVNQSQAGIERKVHQPRPEVPISLMELTTEDEPYPLKIVVGTVCLDFS